MRINGVCGNSRKWMTVDPRATGYPLINNVSPHHPPTKFLLVHICRYVRHDLSTHA